MVSIAEELRKSFPLHGDERFGGISRLPAHLHLLYYQVSYLWTHHVDVLSTDRCIDHYSDHKTTTILLFEKGFRIAQRSGGSRIVPQNQTFVNNGTRRLAKDSKHSREPTRSGFTGYDEKILLEEMS